MAWRIFLIIEENFSHNSSNCAQFRPSYPDEVFSFLEPILTGRDRVWDCATGTRKIAVKLVDSFEAIQATGLSENELKNLLNL